MPRKSQQHFYITLLLPHITMALLLILVALPAHAAETKGTGDGRSSVYLLTFDDIRDMGICLSQVKHQAKLLYLEATRTKADGTTKPEVVAPETISMATMNPQANYLPCRREWLFFSIGSLEPVIRMMGNDVKDVESGEYKLQLPQTDKEQIDKYWQEWSANVSDVNKSLDRLFDILDHDLGNNKAVAEQAVAIFDCANRLEAIRIKAYELELASTKSSN